MKQIAGLVCLSLAVGCGAAPAASVVEPPASTVQAEEPSAASASPRESVARTDAVDARLDGRPSFVVAWSTRLDAISRDDVAALCAYERESVHPSPIEVDCGDGRHAVVGANGGACRQEGFDDAQVLGTRCSVTVGDLVACELALREHPCVYAGVGLPECAAFDECRELIHEQADQYIRTCQRVPYDR